MARRHPRFGVVFVITILALACWPVVYWYLLRAGLASGFHHGDFGAYYLTVLDWQAGEALYEEPYFGGWLYPPVYVLGFYPLVEQFTFDTAALVWVIGSVLALWFALQLLIAAHGTRLWWWERLGMLWLVVGFHPVLYGMRLGQASMALAAIVTLAFAAMVVGERTNRSGVRLVSGGLTAVGGTVKLFYAPVGAHLLLDRVRFIGAVLTGLGLGAVSIAVFGFETNLAYLDVLAWGEDWGQGPLPPTRWIPGYYRPFYVVADISLFIRAVVLGGIVALLIWTRHTDGDREAFTLGIVSIPLLAPQVSTHDFAVVLAGIVALCYLEFEHDRRPTIPLLALLLLHIQAYGTRVFVSLPDALPGASLLAEGAPILQPGLYGNVLLIGLAAYRLYEHRPIERVRGR